MAAVLDSAARPARLGERHLAAALVAALVVLAVALRLVPILVAPSLNWGDELFQAMEPAHRLVFGYGLVAWEFQLGLRSWLLPGMIAGLMELSRLVGDGPAYYLPVIAVAFALLASAPAICCFLWVRRRHGLAAALVAGFALAVAPELVYFGARTLSEVVAAHLLVVAFYLAASDTPAGARRLFVAGALFGLAAVLRIQIVPAVAVMALWPALPAWRRTLRPLVAGGMAALAFAAALDWATLGYPFASLWRYLYYNLYLGISADFDLNPWYYYLAGELGVWLVAAPLLVLLVGLGARRQPALLAGALVVIAVHSAIAHKEYRFIYPAIVLLMMLAALGLGEVAGWGAAWLQRIGWRKSLAHIAPPIVLAVLWAAASAQVWSGGLMTALRQRDHDQLLAIAYVRDLPAPCGIGVYGKDAWVWYGGYTYLHRPIPLYWPADAAALAADAGAFDTLVAPAAAPSAAGFTHLHCFGDACVARRRGTCAPRPMPAMWFPRQLRATAPSPQEFEALPASALPKHTEGPR